MKPPKRSSRTSTWEKEFDDKFMYVEGINFTGDFSTLTAFKNFIKKVEKETKEKSVRETIKVTMNNIDTWNKEWSADRKFVGTFYEWVIENKLSSLNPERE